MARGGARDCGIRYGNGWDMCNTIHGLLPAYPKYARWAQDAQEGAVDLLPLPHSHQYPMQPLIIAMQSDGFRMHVLYPALNSRAQGDMKGDHPVHMSRHSAPQVLRMKRPTNWHTLPQHRTPSPMPVVMRVMRV